MNSSWTSHALFPLTPALSLGERENPSPVVWRADVAGWFSGRFCEGPESGDNGTRIRIGTGHRLLFPLPQGEGKGEGEATPALERWPETGPATRATKIRDGAEE